MAECGTITEGTSTTKSHYVQEQTHKQNCCENCCDHCLHHCSKCNVVYCCKCTNEWHQDNYYYPPPLTGITTPWYPDG